MQESADKGHIPLVYLHPYEFTSDFWVPWKELKFLPTVKRFKVWIRQLQWCWLGHRTLEKKLKKISQTFSHQGRMDTLL